MGYRDDRDALRSEVDTLQKELESARDDQQRLAGMDAARLTPSPAVRRSAPTMTDDSTNPHTLDPRDWEAFRATGHRMLDDMIDFLRDVRERPAWQPMPDEAKAELRAPMPIGPSPLEAIYEDFRRTILPFTSGNIHPGFLGWVAGSGTPTGMLAELLAAGMNSNVGGREHAAVYVERQVIAWCRALFSFPDSASGLLVTGTSMANLIAMVTARTARLGASVRAEGLREAPRLTAYAARSAHSCVTKAAEISGLGRDSLRLIPLDAAGRMDLGALAQAIAADRLAGATPFFVIGTAGTVDTGAIDDLAGLAALAAAENLWFHVDGAFGALAMMSPELSPRLQGIERADSIAFDFHKWAHAPYDAGCILVRDGAQQRAAFAVEPPYLARFDRGAAAGAPWFSDFGPDLSRGFRALKVWFTWREHGSGGLGQAMLENCRQAEALAAAVDAAEELERLAPVSLNIVCFRFRHAGMTDEALNHLNKELVVQTQESGIAVPSTTVIDGRLAIRVNLTNHRTTMDDLHRMLAFVRSRGAELSRLHSASTSPHPPR